MEEFATPHYYGCCALCIFLLFLVLAVVGAKPGTIKKLRPNLPPGPWQLPVIGSSHWLLSRLPPHRRMRDLSLRHGPIMQLRICERAVVVVSSAEAAEAVIRDAAFEQRPTSPALDELYSRYGMGIVFAPYGDHWRLLRRVLVNELLSAQRVESFRRIREQEAARLVSSLQQAAASAPGQLANIDERLAAFVTDSAVRAIFGDRTMPDRAALLDTVEQALDFSSLFDLRDLFPSSWLARMLPRNGKAERNRLAVVRLMEGILRLHEERRSSAGQADDGQDMVDVLLRIRNDEGAMGSISLTHGIIVNMLMVMSLVFEGLVRTVQLHR
jgi:cytochrome P450